MLDAVQFEDLQLPAVPILTEPFRSTGLAMAELRGYVDYPFVTVAHPVTSLSMEQTLALADMITPAVESHLVDGPLIDEAASSSRTSVGRFSPAAAEEAGSVVDFDDLVEDLAAGLRSDGADLSGHRSGTQITFRLHIPDEACAQCVMPSTMLMPMFQRRVDSVLGRGFSVDIEDPRLDTPS
ncbi:MAG: hypothetical protein F4098_00365 [Acidimicrobiaceae bacterium]|nr:hypothetical protein [Acidimicrobiaceae bacterium]